MKWGRRRATGCIRLGYMIRAARRHREITQAELACRMNADPPLYAPLEYDRGRVAQWEGAYRRIRSCDLQALAKALDVEFEGINWHTFSDHHAEHYCSADLGGVPRVTCRSTGNAIWRDGNGRNG